MWWWWGGRGWWRGGPVEEARSKSPNAVRQTRDITGVVYIFFGAIRAQTPHSKGNPTYGSSRLSRFIVSGCVKEPPATSFGTVRLYHSHNIRSLGIGTVIYKCWVFYVEIVSLCSKDLRLHIAVCLFFSESVYPSLSEFWPPKHRCSFSKHWNSST